MPNIKSIAIDRIILDPDIQPRAEMDKATIEEYAEVLRSGGKLPPIRLFRDQEGVLRVADGFTRIAAHKRAGLTEIKATVVTGSKRDAMLFAVGANADHGQRRTNADKRRAVMTLLNDPEWSQQSQTWIAEKCAVSQQFISQIRSQLYNSCINGAESDKPKTPGRSKINGHDADDPSDVAEARAAGKIPADAVVQIDEPEDTTRLEDVQEQHAEAAAIADDLSDEDWLATLPLSAILTGQQLKVFQADALIYHYLEYHRKTYGYHASRLMDRHSKGEFAWRVKQFLAINHPKDWIRCPATDQGGCDGNGFLGPPLGLMCNKCHGRGYWIK
jgi:hypothetical protein